jgi:hypothetical protein
MLFGALLVVLALVHPDQALGQDLPKPLPEDQPHQGWWNAADNLYPSAKVCGECHPRQFEQWSVSSHAYANLSPMFNKFEQKINDLASGTISHFCVRCHASVGSALGERRDIAWWERSAASQEGITCVSCHRVGEGYGKTNSARRITPGSIHEPVFGPFEASGGLKAISNAMKFGILVSPDQPDKPTEEDGKKWIRIHQTAIQSDIIVKSDLCVACHQVQVHPGIKLETVWEEYLASPAAKEGITCQQCHMSTNPGQNVGYAKGWAAKVNGFTMRDDRPLTDHTFVGPGYPISHPGLFPFRLEESPFTPQQWLKFDYRAKWGSDDFERTAAGSATIPPEWQNPADRRKAWQIVQENYERWHKRREMREKMLENASEIEGPIFKGRPEAGKAFAFEYRIHNRNKGHNLPSGSLGAQPELWLNVALHDPDGNIVWESGYVDKYGDVADLQSKEVREGTIDHDDQLVSMQAKFITTNVKGTDREMYLPINLDVDQRPFIRPGGTPTSLLNHPPLARMEKRSIPPLGTRVAKYKVPGSKITKPGTYKLAVRLRGRTEPIYFMEFVESTRDMIRSENEWADDIHPKAAEFEVSGASQEVRELGELESTKGWFKPDPTYEHEPYDAAAQLAIYDAKHMNKTAQPLVQQGIRMYDRGAYTPRPTCLGEQNPINFHFLSYGDLRIGGAYYDNGIANSKGQTDQSVLAARLNLDMDLAITATERLHAFVRPFDRNGSFTRFQLSGGESREFIDEFDFKLETLFFEGDIKAIRQGLTGRTSRNDMPIAFGRVPLFTQNGIWLDDAFDGIAFGITARNSPRFDISNTDLTFFAGFDKVTTAAAPGDNAKVFGLAGFADARKGYFEYGYGYVRADNDDQSYHNLTAAFSRRYRLTNRVGVANSVRVIGNLGQSGPVKTADGVLLLMENSFLRRDPGFLVPYLNLFAGFDRPQPLARAAGTGNALRNTGINFESDGLTGYPTLDDTAEDALGAAAGVEKLWGISQQLVVEGAIVQRMGSSTLGNQYALGVRFQRPLNNAWIFRADAMHGWRQGQNDVYGVRVELRRKF